MNTMQQAIERSRIRGNATEDVPRRLHQLMNQRKGIWGLINGQLVRFGRLELIAGKPLRDEHGREQCDFTKIDTFVKHAKADA